MNPKTDTDRFVSDDGLYYGALCAIVFMLATKELGSIEYKLGGTIVVFSSINMLFAFKTLTDDLSMYVIWGVRFTRKQFIRSSNGLSIAFDKFSNLIIFSINQFSFGMKWILGLFIPWSTFVKTNRPINTFRQPPPALDLNKFSALIRFSVIILAIWMASHSYYDHNRYQYGEESIPNHLYKPL